MTGAATRPFWSATFEAMGAAWRRTAEMLGKAVIGAALVVVAGVVAVAAACAALLIALSALFLRISSRSKPTQTDGAGFDGVTLNARRTARGWTVE